MNVALDLRPALARPTGVGAYVMALARRLPALAPEDRFYFFSASYKERFQTPTVWPPNVALVDLPLPVSVLNFAWNRLGRPRLDRLVRASLDLIHSPHPLIIPGRRAKHIITIHDLFFFKHPEMTDAEVRRDYAPLIRDHAKRADGIICPSEYTAAEARLLLGVPAEKIAVIPEGVDPAYREPVSEEEIDHVLRRRGLPRGALLYVGSEERRKNLVHLSMAYMGLAGRGTRVAPLILVGPGTHWASGGEIASPRIHATGYLETREIRALMAASAALVLPSLEEGFGLPVVDAMAAGLPVVCSKGSALEEVAGDAAVLVNPLDVSSIARGIERVLHDKTLAAEKREAGLVRSRAFDWDVAAAQTLAFYRRVAAG